MKIIIVPDEGEWVAVPKVTTPQYLFACQAASTPQEFLDAMLAAAPPCKVVELPERDIRDDPSRGHSQSVRDYQEGWNDCLDEIELRAKDAAKD